MRIQPSAAKLHGLVMTILRTSPTVATTLLHLMIGVLAMQHCPVVAMASVMADGSASTAHRGLMDTQAGPSNSSELSDLATRSGSERRAANIQFDVSCDDYITKATPGATSTSLHAYWITKGKTGTGLSTFLLKINFNKAGPASIVVNFEDATYITTTIYHWSVQSIAGSEITFQNDFGTKVFQTFPRRLDLASAEAITVSCSAFTLLDTCGGYYTPGDVITPRPDNNSDPVPMASYSYDFVFADSTRAIGTSESPNVVVFVDGLSFIIDISCADSFPDGYGEIDGPVEGVNPRVISYNIWQYRN